MRRASCDPGRRRRQAARGRGAPGVVGRQRADPVHRRSAAPRPASSRSCRTSITARLAKDADEAEPPDEGARLPARRCRRSPARSRSCAHALERQGRGHRLLHGRRAVVRDARSTSPASPPSCRSTACPATLDWSQDRRADPGALRHARRLGDRRGRASRSRPRCTRRRWSSTSTTPSTPSQRPAPRGLQPRGRQAGLGPRPSRSCARTRRSLAEGTEREQDANEVQGNTTNCRRIFSEATPCGRAGT